MSALDFREQAAIAFATIPETHTEDGEAEGGVVYTTEHAIRLAIELARQACEAWGHDYRDGHESCRRCDWKRTRDPKVGAQ